MRFRYSTASKRITTSRRGSQMARLNVFFCLCIYASYSAAGNISENFCCVFPISITAIVRVFFFLTSTTFIASKRREQIKISSCQRVSSQYNISLAYFLSCHGDASLQRFSLVTLDSFEKCLLCLTVRREFL